MPFTEIGATLIRTKGFDGLRIEYNFGVSFKVVIDAPIFTHF